MRLTNGRRAKIGTLLASYGACETYVAIDRSVEFVESNVLAVGVGDEEGAGTEQQRRAPSVEQRNIGREGEDGRLEPIHDVQPHVRDAQDLFNRDERAEHGDRAQDVLWRTDRAEHHLGRR